MLVTRKESGERSVGAKEGGYHRGVVGRRVGRSAPGRVDNLGRHGPGIGVGRRERFGEESRDRPLVRRDERQHGLLQRFVKAGRLVSQPQKQLARGVGIVQGAVGPWLRETHLQSEHRKAVARRRRQEDARHVQRVEDLSRGVPQARRRQEVDVEPGAVPDRLAAVQEVGQLAKGGLGACRAPELLLLDAGEPQHYLGD